MRLALGVCGALSLLLPSALQDSPRATIPLAATPAFPTPPTTDDPPAGLTRDDWSQIRHAVRASGYHASRVSKPGEVLALQAANREQAYRTTFRPEGIEIVPRSQAEASWRLGVSVVAYGYEGDVRPIEAAAPQASKDRVEYRRGALTEWYVNRPAGLEQGFELEEPQPRRPGPLVITMTVRGDLDVSTGDDGASFANRSGETLVRYTGLKAWDAEGRPLESRLETENREVRLVVQAEAARFPVTVDPIFIHEAQLFGHSDVGQKGAGFGFSVSLSGDTVVVGEPFRDTGDLDAGAANIFVRSGTSWTLQQKLLASDGDSGDGFGHAVSISGDTIVVGAPLYDDAPMVNEGRAYVFVRSGATWTEQQKLVASDGAAADFFGNSVSVSGDTLVIGAHRDDVTGVSDAGSAYVFVRAGATWTEQQKLLASDGVSSDFFGASVAIDQDTVVVGAIRDDTAGGVDTGSAYVFVRSGTAWTEEQKLVASDGMPGDFFGGSVAVAQDTVVVGEFSGHTHSGSAYVFVRSGSTWSEQQKLVASDAMPGDGFGNSVSLSGDVAVIGTPFDDQPSGPNGGSAYVFDRVGTTWSEQQKLLASDGTASDRFGFAVSIDGNTVVVGVSAADVPGGANAGSAHVFVASGGLWAEQQKLLVPETATVNDEFGHSVSVSGDTVVVGANDDDTPAGADAGSAYVYVRSGTTWTEQQKLMASSGAYGDNFGASVSISGDTVVVGAPSDFFAGGPGSAYVFVRSGTTWSQQQKLLASDGEVGEEFGISVSISGDTVVVGAYHDNTPAGSHAGSAYVFVRSGTTWSEQQKLLASDGAGGDLFGFSVSIDGDTVVVGAMDDDTPAGTGAGSAYVYVRTGTAWSEQQKLMASDGAPEDFFGESVSLSADTVVVGAYLDDTPAGSSAGSAYVFVRSGTSWTEQQKLVASDAAQNDAFGVSVSVSGDVAVIGVPFDDTPGGFDAGSAYVFVRSGSTWTEQQKLLAPDGAVQDYFGYSVSASADTVLVGASSDSTPGGTDAGSAHVFGDGSAYDGIRRGHLRRRGLGTGPLLLQRIDSDGKTVPQDSADAGTRPFHSLLEPQPKH